MNYSVKSKLLISAGVIACASSIWHLLCIFGGFHWFAFARAPQQIIDSSQQGTLLAPIGKVIVASLMFSCTDDGGFQLSIQWSFSSTSMAIISCSCSMKANRSVIPKYAQTDTAVNATRPNRFFKGTVNSELSFILLANALYLLVKLVGGLPAATTSAL